MRAPPSTSPEGLGAARGAGVASARTTSQAPKLFAAPLLPLHFPYPHLPTPPARGFLFRA